MPTNSPNNSILTFSPLLATKRIRDHFQTPPNPSNQQISTTNINASNTPNTHITGTSNNNIHTDNQKSRILPLPNSYLFQSSPQNNKRIDHIIQEEEEELATKGSNQFYHNSKRSYAADNDLSNTSLATNTTNIHDNAAHNNPNAKNIDGSSTNGTKNTSSKSNNKVSATDDIHSNRNINRNSNIDNLLFNSTSNTTANYNDVNNKSNGDIKNANSIESSAIVDGFQPLTQADKLRLWRHDALLQHHYKTAIYIGDKVLSLTDDPNDAFWLAQAHYASCNYQIARNLLSDPKFEASVGCRYLSGLCLYKLDKLDEALDIIGEVNPFKKDHSIRNPDGGIKLEASMCYLRGLIYNKQNNFERAKDCFKEAVLVDVKCFEAFDDLISNHLLTPNEEWELLNCLNFEDADSNNELVKMLYTTHINKYKNLGLYEDAKQRLVDEYDLGENIDILLSQAELYFIKCKFQQCLDICTKIIERDELNIAALSNYLSCLYELGGKNKLFLMSHKLAENYPNHYITWVAIGIYYFAIKKTSEARMFFSKASIINPNFAAAWIGFAHTFAADGEHEQAISAYATASRLFPGTHLPNLFLGMQYLQMSNYTLSWEYLNYSYSICQTDPLLLNEIGVLHYHKNELRKSEIYLKKALVVSKTLEYGSKAWCSINCNLAHVYRRMGVYNKAIFYFNEVLKIAKNDFNIYSTLGLICLKVGKVANAIEYLHIALSIQPNDSIATDLLDKALDLNIKVANKKMLNKSLELASINANSGKTTSVSGFSDILKSLSSQKSKDKKFNGKIDDNDEIMDIESE